MTAIPAGAAILLGFALVMFLCGEVPRRASRRPRVHPALLALLETTGKPPHRAAGLEDRHRRKARKEVKR
jgi:hypothetical protein